MAYSRQTKRALREAYLSGLSLPKAAAQAGVKLSTARRWKKEAGAEWDRIRAAQRLSGDGLEAVVQGILGDMILLHQTAVKKINELDKSPEECAALLASLTDSLVKTTKSLGHVAPKLSRLGAAMEILRDLADFIQAEHPRQTQAFLEILEPFGELMAKKHG